MKERGIVVSGGQGGFLNPPTHPEHSFHVETDLRRRKENRGSLSLEYATTCEWLDDATRAAAKRKLQAWQRPALESPEVQEWVLQVLGYFRNCYKGDGPEPECWNANKLKIGPGAGTVDEHAGVRLIRKYYPEFVPTDVHFARAYWGTKPAE